MRRLRSILLSCTVIMAVPHPAHATSADRFFKTSDGVRLHVIEAGPTFGRTIVFVPGWTMPAWIFQRQIAFFSRDYHVLALDPRGQGDSEAPAQGYEPNRRGADIAELIATQSGRPVLLVGWSLGVLDSLAYVHNFGDGLLNGLVLIDNSIGEDPPPPPHVPSGRRAPAVPREISVARFVRSMFHHSPGEAYLDRLIEASLRTPPDASAALLAYPVPRSYWKEAVYAARKPVLYVVTPRLAGQADNLAIHDPFAETQVFAGSGHALFVDDADRFDSTMLDFIRRRVWP
jgi:non-heme chloroperoxidase